MIEAVDIGWQRRIAAPPIATAALLDEGDGLTVDDPGGDAGDVELGRLQPPAKFPTEQVDGEGLADVRGGGDDRRGADQPGNVPGEGVGAADMAGQGRDDEAPGLIDHQDTGVLVLGLEVRGDEAGYRAQGDKENELVVGGEEWPDLVAQGPAVGLNPEAWVHCQVRRFSQYSGEFFRDKERDGTGCRVRGLQASDEGCGLHDTLAGDGDQGDGRDVRGGRSGG